MLHAIELTESDGDGTLLELRGDLDGFSLPELSAALDRVAGLRRSALIDLSGVTFLDVQSARELTRRSWLYGHHVALVNPSWQVLASVGACGMGDWARFGTGHNRPEVAAFPEPPGPA